MKIDRLLDFYEDIELESYVLQKKRLLEGIVLDYSFIRFDPFKGIKRKNNIWMVDDLDADSGIYSFLLNSDLFFITNPDVGVRINLEYILLFSDEYYEFQIISGSYKTKPIILQFKDLMSTTFFEQDELILSLIKNKNVKISLKLKESSKTRITIESRFKIEDTATYAKDLFNNFINKMTAFQLERSEKVYLFFDVLGIDRENQSKQDLIIKFKSLKLENLNIKKNVLYINLLLNRISRARPSDKKDQILEEIENKYNSKIKRIKLLEYKLKAKYITIRDKND